MKQENLNQGKPIKVLLLEDNTGDARLVIERLKRSTRGSFETEHVETLTKALKRLESEGVDVILSDLHLPDGIGADVIRQLRLKAPQLPVVILTGTYQDEQIAEEALQDGAQDYLFKDGDPGRMLGWALRSALERHRLSEKLKRGKEELEKKISELELLNRVMMGREEKILELKKEIKALQTGGIKTKENAA